MAGGNLETSMSTPSIAAPRGRSAHERHPARQGRRLSGGDAPLPARRRPGPKGPTAFPSPSTPTRPCTSASWSVFYQGHWSYVGLEAEIPKPGDFKRTAVGATRSSCCATRDGQVRVVENVCAHRGVQFCRERHGNRSEFVCPYHQWNYDLQGNLIGVPFRRGVKQDGKVNGGMPPDFKPRNTA